jgi:hypothetical protein
MPDALKTAYVRWPTFFCTTVPKPEESLIRSNNEVGG